MTAKKLDAHAMALECSAIASAVPATPAKAGEPQPVGHDGVGIRQHLADAEQAFRAGDYVAAAGHLKLAWDDAWAAFFGPATMAAGSEAEPVKGKWLDLLKLIGPLLLKLLPLLPV